MARHASTSRTVHETVGRSLALLLGVVLLLIIAGTFAPRTAQAEKTPMWQLEGVRVYTLAPNPSKFTYSYDQNSMNAHAHLKNKEDEKDPFFQYDYSWDEWATWEDPPESIPVGNEPDMWLTMQRGYSNFSGRFGGDSYGYAYGLRAGSAVSSYGVFNRNETTIDDLFDDFGERYAADATHRADDGYDFWNWGSGGWEPSSMSAENWGGPIGDLSLSLSEIKKNPAGSVTHRFHVEEGFISRYHETSEYSLESAVRRFLRYCDYSEDAYRQDGIVLGMSIAITVPVATVNGNVTVVYLYSYDPASGGTSANGGKENVEVDTDPPNTPGEFGVWAIPVAVVGVFVVAGGAATLVRRGRKGGDDGPGDDEPPDDEPDEPSTFRMALYKEFGDTLFVGGGPQTVGALIEEVTPEGQVFVRDDLTARITFSVSANLSATDIGTQNHYRCVNVEALKADHPEAVVSIVFAGEGGTFTNNVHFKVGKAELYFGDVALTFIAGYKQTLSIPFCFVGMQVPVGKEPKFECTVWSGVGGDGADFFTDAEVVRDRERPNEVWNVRLTETGAAPKLEPGELERFTCEVTATWAGAEGEQKITGIFNLYRFVEGIRLHVEPLKCYAVDRKAKFVEFRGRNADEPPAEFKAQLDAWRAQLPEDSAKNEYVIPVEYEGVQQQAARSVIRATLYTWGAGQVDERGEFVFHDHGAGYIEMPDWDGTDPWVAVKAVNPLPEFGKTKIEFADVPGSSVLKDDEGNDIARPCELFGFAYFLKKIDHEDNEQTFHVVATKGIMTPPNRVQVDVTVRMEWSGRTFERTERVMAISQPWRADYAEKAAAYDAADAKKLEWLVHIQNKILHSESTTWKIEGGVSLVETGAAIQDAFDDSAVKRWKEEGVKKLGESVDENFESGGNALKTVSGVADMAVNGPKSLEEVTSAANETARLAGHGAVGLADKMSELSPVYQTARVAESAGRAVIYTAKSISEQRKDKYMTYTEYGDMMPLYHYIQMMLDGYEKHYGFHEPDYLRVTNAFLARSRGETGPAQAVMEAYFSRDLQYCDAVRMTVKAWNESWAITALSIGCSIATGGLSDAFFIPLAAIGKGLEGAIDCIDRGGASNFEIFRSTCDAAARQIVLDVAMNKIGEKAMEWASFGKGFAESVTKELGAEKLFQDSLKGLGSMFSSGKAGAATASAAKVLKSELDEAYRAARAMKEAYEQSGEALADGVLQRDLSYIFGRIEGKTKLANIDKVMKSGAKDLTRFERRQLLFAIQSDKHAMRALMADTSELGVAARKFYNAEIKEVQEKAIHMTRVRLADQGGVPLKEIRVASVTGNVSDDVARGLKTPMDKDVTFQRFGGYDAEGQEIWVDILEQDAQPAFDQELFKVVHGYEGSAEAAAEFARAADHTAVSRFGPESYGKWADAMRVVDASRAGETLEDAGTVGLTAERKCVEWQRRAREAWADAAAARAAGDAVTAELYEEAAESFVEEGARQFNKQARRIVEERLAVLRRHGERLPEGIQDFLNKAAAIDLMGLEKLDGATAADVEGMLKKQYGTTLEEVYHELNELTVKLNDRVARINGDRVAPGVVKNL